MVVRTLLLYMHVHVALIGAATQPAQLRNGHFRGKLNRLLQRVRAAAILTGLLTPLYLPRLSRGLLWSVQVALLVESIISVTILSFWSYMTNVIVSAVMLRMP